MKRIYLFLPALVFGLVLLFSACDRTGYYKDSTGHSQNAAPIDLKRNMPPKGEGPEYTSAYICPEHHKGSGSHKPGECPVCGADYIKNIDHVKDEVSHSGE
jgi:hypothetical protein